MVISVLSCELCRESEAKFTTDSFRMHCETTYFRLSHSMVDLLMSSPTVNYKGHQESRLELCDLKL